jgi:predicted metal-dependent peptidase
MVQTQGLERMKQARARLVLNRLFWGAASMPLRLVVDNAQPTAYTDGKVIGFNETYVNALTDIAHVETLICHETLHCIMMHPLRLKGRDHRLANIAMDYVVNGICVRAGLPLIPNTLYDEKYSAANMSFEIVYSLLKQEEEKKKKGDGSGRGDGRGKKEKGENGDGEKSEGQGEPSDNGEPSEQEGGGKPIESWRQGEVREPKNDAGQELSESERTQIENEWKVNAAKAIHQAREAGKIPAGLERLVRDMTIAKRDLEDVLRDFIIKTLNGDYSYSRPNKRHIIRDIYLPSIKGEAIPLIAMVMDTSGSINQEQIDYFQAKINSVLSEFETTVHVLYCDTKVHDGGEFNSGDLPIKLKPKGFGGTDFRPAFKWLEKNEIEPTCLIYYTDGYCESFPAEPDYPVLWALYGEERKFPFGEFISIVPE